MNSSDRNYLYIPSSPKDLIKNECAQPNPFLDSDHLVRLCCLTLNILCNLQIESSENKVINPGTYSL